MWFSWQQPIDKCGVLKCFGRNHIIFVMSVALKWCVHIYSFVKSLINIQQKLISYLHLVRYSGSPLGVERDNHLRCLVANRTPPSLRNVRAKTGFPLLIQARTPGTYTTYSRLGSQVKVPTSWETCKLDLQLMFYLNLLFQNTWSFINWWLCILWHPRIDYSHVLLNVMQELGCFELVYVKSLMKSQSHETRSSMKLTAGGNIYDQSTRNWQH